MWKGLTGGKQPISKILGNGNNWIQIKHNHFKREVNFVNCQHFTSLKLKIGKQEEQQWTGEKYWYQACCKFEQIFQMAALNLAKESKSFSRLFLAKFCQPMSTQVDGFLSFLSFSLSFFVKCLSFFVIFLEFLVFHERFWD